MGKETHKFVFIPLLLWDQNISHKKQERAHIRFQTVVFLKKNTETESDKKPVKEIEKLPKVILSGKTEEGKQKLLSFIKSDHKKFFFNALFKSSR